MHLSKTAATLLIVTLVTPLTALAAGKLSRARSAVRASSPPRPANNNSSSHSDDDDDDHDHKPAPQPKRKLAAARKEVRASSAPAPRSRPHHHGRSRHHHHRPSYGAAINFRPYHVYEPYCVSPTYVETHVYEAPYAAETVVPAEPISPPGELIAPAVPSAPDPVVPQFPAYPYAGGTQQCVVTQPDYVGHEWLGRFQFEVGSDFGGLDRRGASFMIEGIGGWGVDFDWDSYSEELPGGGRDELHLGDVNILFRVAETEHSMWRVGAGIDWLGDAAGADAGVNFTVKADYMPSEPLIFSGEIDYGTMGDAEMFHGSATMGLLLDRFEIYGGYDYRNIGGAELQGPMMGLRIWF